MNQGERLRFLRNLVQTFPPLRPLAAFRSVMYRLHGVVLFVFSFDSGGRLASPSKELKTRENKLEQQFSAHTARRYWSVTATVSTFLSCSEHTSTILLQHWPILA